MASPYPITVTTVVDFGSSPTFGQPFTLDNATFGKLDSRYGLGGGTTNLVDISSSVLDIKIAGGYNLLQDQFETNQGTIRVYDPNGWWNPQNTASPYYGYLTPNRKITLTCTYKIGRAHV